MNNPGPTKEQEAEVKKILDYLKGHKATYKQMEGIKPFSSNIRKDLDANEQKQRRLQIGMEVLARYMTYEGYGQDKIRAAATEVADAMYASHENIERPNIYNEEFQAALRSETQKWAQKRQKAATVSTPESAKAKAPETVNVAKKQPDTVKPQASKEAVQPKRVEENKSHNIYGALKQLRKGIRLITSALNTLSIALGFQKAPPKKFDPKKFLETLKEVEAEIAAKVKAQDQLKAKGPVNHEEMVRVAKEIEDKKAKQQVKGRQVPPKPEGQPPLIPVEALGPLPPLPKAKATVPPAKKWEAAKPKQPKGTAMMGKKPMPEKSPTGMGLPPPPPSASPSNPPIVTAEKQNFVRDQKARIEQKEAQRQLAQEAAKVVKGKPPSKT